MAFATYQDVEDRWRTLTADEQARCTTLLGDASNILASKVVVVDGDADQAALLRQVCCNMVIRSMVVASSDAFGVDELSATMGPFSQTVQYANPNGDLYLTKFEKGLLGIDGSSGRILSPSVGGDLVAQLPDAL